MKTKVIAGVILTLVLVSMLSTVMSVSAGGYIGPEDLDEDGDVDIYDFVIMAAAFGSRPGDSDWDARADIYDDINHQPGGDGVIDIYDLVMVATKYGAGC